MMTDRAVCEVSAILRAGGAGSERNAASGSNSRRLSFEDGDWPIARLQK